MGIPISLAVITLAALIHASFQLSISVLTLLSAHTIGAKRSRARLLHLTTSFVFGAGIMTLLLIATTSLIFENIFFTGTPQLIWAATCGLMGGMAIAIWIFYYRREKGTMLWVPRNVARYLTSRTELTKHGAEAFSLGSNSVIAELLFIIAPLIISALVIIQLPAMWQIVGVAIYAMISTSSLVVVWIAISSGHSLSRIQKWRETNKKFLQFAAGAGLIVLSVFVYVNEIVVNAIGSF